MTNAIQEKVKLLREAEWDIYKYRDIFIEFS